MKRNDVYLRHILDELKFLIDKSEDLKFDEFMENEILQRAFTRSLEIIGEAVKNISPDFKEKHDDIEWKKIAGLRDKVIHYYFNVNWEIVWDVIKNKAQDLNRKIEKIMEVDNFNS